jgi:hypothetical protein
MAWTCGNNTPWPDTWVAMLKLMHPKGYSASTIATHINAKFRGANLSRNAVIGKIMRLGLKRDEAFNERNRAAAREAGKRAGTIRRSKTQFGKGEPIPAPSAPPPRIPTVHVSTITGAIIPGPSSLPPKPLPAPAAVTGQPITTLEITSKTCCWPLNDGAPEWLFCGGERDHRSQPGHDRGYCKTHLAKSLQRRAA